MRASPCPTAHTNRSPVLVPEDDPTPSRNNQIARASSLVLSSLKVTRGSLQTAMPCAITRNSNPRGGGMAC